MSAIISSRNFTIPSTQWTMSLSFIPVKILAFDVDGVIIPSSMYTTNVVNSDVIVTFDTPTAGSVLCAPGGPGSVALEQNFLITSGFYVAVPPSVNSLSIITTSDGLVTIPLQTTLRTLKNTGRTYVVKTCTLPVDDIIRIATVGYILPSYPEINPSLAVLTKSVTTNSPLRVVSNTNITFVGKPTTLTPAFIEV